MDVEEQSAATGGGDGDSFADAAKSLSISSIASRLLADKLYLTALELYAELQDRGRELAVLRNFFTNPANFETCKVDTHLSKRSLQRSPSAQTLDTVSMISRYSDDTNLDTAGDEIAVLKFQLRKAEETIGSLRSHFTRSVEHRLGAETADGAEHQNDTASCSGVTDILPFERRVLNFLVNEYLLRNGYKLTSVTMAEEIDQDLDDWEDVGLNTAKPPTLLQLYRDFSRHRNAQPPTATCACQTDLTADQLESTIEQRSALERRCAELVGELAAERRECGEQRRLAGELELKLKELKVALAQSSAVPSALRDPDDTPDRSRSGTLRLDAASLPDCPRPPDNDEPPVDNLSVTPSANAEYRMRGMSSSLSEHIKAHYEQLSPNADADDRQIDDIWRQHYLNGQVDFVGLIAQTTSHLGVESVSPSSRHWLAPQLLCVAHYHAESGQRYAATNALLSLWKRPTAEQRQLVVRAVVLFCQHSRSAANTDDVVVPLVAQEVVHKDVERRLLAARVVGAVAAYVSPQIRSSMLLSVIDQLLQDRDDAVRSEAAVALSAVLAQLPGDADRYLQRYQCFVGLLAVSGVDLADVHWMRSQQRSLLQVAVGVLLPSLAVSAADAAMLDEHLMPAAMDRVQKSCVKCFGADWARTWRDALDGGVALWRVQPAHRVELAADLRAACLAVDVLRSLVPVFVSWLLLTAPTADRVAPPDPAANAAAAVGAPSLLLVDAAGVYRALFGSHSLYNAYTANYTSTVRQEWFASWPAHSWLTDTLIPWLVQVSAALTWPAMDGDNWSAPKDTELASAFFHWLDDESAACVLSERVGVLTHTLASSFSGEHVRGCLWECFEPRSDDVGPPSAHCSSLLLSVVLGGLWPAALLGDATSLRGHFHRWLGAVFARCASPPAVAALVAAVRTFCRLAPAHLQLLLDFLVAQLTAVGDRFAFDTQIKALAIFYTVVPFVSAAQFSSSVLPLLFTVAASSDLQLHAYAVPVFGRAAMQFKTNTDISAKIYEHFQRTMDEACSDMNEDSHLVLACLVRTLGQLSVDSEPSARDHFILPRLAAIASLNHQIQNADARRLVAVCLLDAFTSLSCCFIGQSLINASMLPALRCVEQDMVALNESKLLGVTQTLLHETEARLTAYEGARADDRGANASFSSPDGSHAGRTGTAMQSASSLMKSLSRTTGEAWSFVKKRGATGKNR